MIGRYLDTIHTKPLDGTLVHDVMHSTVRLPVGLSVVSHETHTNTLMIYKRSMSNNSPGQIFFNDLLLVKFARSFRRSDDKRSPVCTTTFRLSVGLSRTSLGRRKRVVSVSMNDDHESDSATGHQRVIVRDAGGRREKSLTMNQPKTPVDGVSLKWHSH